jgi:hypothetical protein
VLQRSLYVASTVLKSMNVLGKNPCLLTIIAEEPWLRAWLWCSQGINQFPISVAAFMSMRKHNSTRQVDWTEPNTTSSWHILICSKAWYIATIWNGNFTQSTQHESIVWDRFGLDEDIPVRVVWLIIGYRYSG